MPIDEFMNVCFHTREHSLKVMEGMETICNYLNDIWEALPDFTFDADNDGIRIKGFYVDELGRLRYETTTKM